VSELDDAIREHLELKRLRGADPGEVARLEQEALGAPARSIALAPQYEHELHANELPEHDAVPQFTLHTNLAASAHPDGGEETQEFSLDDEIVWADESADHARSARN
jgi:hypothetical protein